MSLYLGNKPIANDGSHRITGEIGDMGFAPLGIDESLNLRRYLNGQVISQIQFEAFTTKVKSAVALFPSLATTESNWQAEKALSKFGQVGKFVIDDENQTIRLPAVVNAQGLLGLSGIGGLVNESLPNITGKTDANVLQGGLAWTSNGALYGTKTHNGYVPYNDTTAYEFNDTINFDASRSSSTYQDDAPVQQEAIQYPYYIQVATGIEETLPAIREYKVNNSDYFGKSIYSDIEPNNASLLASNGQYNARAVYPDYYDWLVEQMNKGVDKFKGTTAYQFKGNTPETEAYAPSFTTRNPIVGSVIYGNSPIQALGYATQVNTDGSVVVQDVVNNINATLVFNQELPNIDWFTDYDFVVNQNDQTFRLPLLNGEENLPNYEQQIDNVITGTITSAGQTYTAPKNGVFYQQVNVAYGNAVGVAVNNTMQQHIWEGGNTNSYSTGFSVEVRKGDVIRLYIAYGSSTGTIEDCHFTPFKGNGTLYYYVGDVVQDASLINAGAALSQLSDKISRTAVSDRELVVSWGMPDYSAGVALSPSTLTTITTKGWINYTSIRTNAIGGVTVSGVLFQSGSSATNDRGSMMIPVDVGDTIQGVSGGSDTVTFYPCKGV